MFNKLEEIINEFMESIERAKIFTNFPTKIRTQH